MPPSNKGHTLQMNLLVGSYADVEHEVKRVVEGCFGRHGEYTYTLSKFQSNIENTEVRDYGGRVELVPTTTTYSVQATATWIPA